MTPRQKRMAGVAFIVIGMAAATALITTAFNQNLMLFYSPSEVVAGEVPVDRKFRIGGLVVVDSVERSPDSLDVKFELTDTEATVAVMYDDILPDLFREGQGIVANGRLNAKGVFVADEVLAKHDENYMPPEVTSALAKAKEGDGSPAQTP